MNKPNETIYLITSKNNSMTLSESGKEQAKQYDLELIEDLIVNFNEAKQICEAKIEEEFRRSGYRDIYL